MSSQSIDDPFDCTDDEPGENQEEYQNTYINTPIDTFELIERCKLIVNNLKDYAMRHGLNMLTSDNAANNLSRLLE